MKRHLVLMLTAAFGLALAGCNTVKGAGKDIESVGQAGSDVIHK